MMVNTYSTITISSREFLVNTRFTSVRDCVQKADIPKTVYSVDASESYRAAENERQGSATGYLKCYKEQNDAF
ncbi:hypothetical protein TNIN_171801 [Trichonephila inaurata madagascariensis]|uniref:Uncharacterized protein n=1 Tax=Trichonephila inaurata madagascariensis TaxID=2747483 RepID=A0A8X7C856_9ARAC|nr:hypothetical protein TNIN_171801 [Trichonephila inaurata madagascariensis]